MNPAALQDIKGGLQQFDAKELRELCLQLARYKKDNKEYLGFLLFDAKDKRQYTEDIKAEVRSDIAAIDPATNLYYVKKHLRKLLRQINKYCRYIGDKALSADLRICFCAALKASDIPFRRNTLIRNLYDGEIKKIGSLISVLHEDIRGDWTRELEAIRLD